MKRPYSSCLLLLLIIAGTSCKHNSADYTITGDYMIIGRAGGFVALPYDTYYLISGSQLREDTTVPYAAIPDDISKFNFNIVMPASKYDSVKNLPASIPSELLGRNNQTIGSYIPDAGYTDIRTSINGVAYKWIFAPDQSSSSPAIHHFLDSVAIVFN